MCALIPSEKYCSAVPVVIHPLNLASAINNKAHVAIMIDENIATFKNLDAQKIIKETIAPLIKGGGGGQKTLATAGGSDIANLPAIVEKIRQLL